MSGQVKDRMCYTDSHSETSIVDLALTQRPLLIYLGTNLVACPAAPCGICCGHPYGSTGFRKKKEKKKKNKETNSLAEALPPS